MSKTVIRVDNLSKRYRIGVEEQQSDTLMGLLGSFVKSPFSNFKRLRNLSTFDGNESADDVIWALKDVSFEVKEGEVLGIIGRNGAGKSTLLKILSRITEPTSGRVEIHGRVSSLLEVGTGFHPELTGRENVFLNGTILGMSKREIISKFDEIVNFSGVEKFLDTPIKRYSSGMTVRLAFAVAAHLDPEILIIDEVLAVGDAAFQRQCLGKMSEVSRSGRTVLFVSHNMGAVNRLCNRTVAIQAGEIVSDGPTEEVIKSYLKRSLPDNIGNVAHMPERSDLNFQIMSVAVTDSHGEPINAIGIWKQVWLEIEFLVRERLSGSNLSITVSRDGFGIFHSFDTDLSPEYSESRAEGLYRAKVPLPAGLLAPGTYTVTVDTGITSVTSIDRHPDAVSFDVTADEEDLLHKSYSRSAAVVVRIPWHIETICVKQKTSIPVDA